VKLGKIGYAGASDDSDGLLQLFAGLPRVKKFVGLLRNCATVELPAGGTFVPLPGTETTPPSNAFANWKVLSTAETDPALPILVVKEVRIATPIAVGG
jgi:hypothetical protein